MVNQTLTAALYGPHIDCRKAGATIISDNVDKQKLAVRLNSLHAGAVNFSPTYTPANDAARYLVHHTLSSLGLSNKNGVKYTLVVASILQIIKSFDVDKTQTIAVPKNDAYYSNYSAGLSIVNTVIDYMVSHDYLSKVPDTGSFVIYDGDDGKKHKAGVVSLYQPNHDLIALELLSTATFTDSHRPTVIIAQSETEGQYYARKRRGEKSPKMTRRAAATKFKRKLGLAEAGVKQLVNNWQEHPLLLPTTEYRKAFYAASATRVYYRGRMDAGGRYQGSWTNLGSNTRLQATIDGEAVSEVDLNASQPTLFSALMGEEMEVPNTYEDFYSEMLTGFTTVNETDTFDKHRQKMKSVAVELIGTGNPLKDYPAENNSHSWKYTKSGMSEYHQYRNKLLMHVPALQRLEKNRGHLNGAGFISFHESEVMQSTLLALLHMGVTAYPIHDCLLVKQSNVDVAVTVYRETYRSYVLDYNNSEGLSPIDFTTPVSIETYGKKKVRVAGGYNFKG